MNNNSFINQSQHSYLQARVIQSLDHESGGALVNFLVVQCSGELSPDVLIETATKIIEQYDVLLNDAIVTNHLLASDSLLASVEQLKREIQHKYQQINDNPQFECHWIGCSDKEQSVLLLAAPAVLADLGSLQLLASAFLQLEPNAQADKLPYGNLTSWLNEALYDEDSEDGRSFWQSMDFHDIGQLKLSARKVKPAGAAFVPQQFNIDYSGELQAKLEQIDAEQLESLALSAWFIVLQKRSGVSQLCINYSAAGRIFDELEAVIGPLDKAIPVKFAASNQDNLGDVVEQVSQALEDSLEWQDCFSWSSVDSSLEDGGKNLRFLPFGFEFRRDTQIDSHPSISAQVIDLMGCEEIFEVKLQHFYNAKEQLCSSLCFDQRTYQRETIEQLAQQWLHVLTMLLDSPLERLDKVSLLTDSAKAQILQSWGNRMVEQAPAVVPIVRIVEQTAQTSPDCIAIETEDKTISYATLNAEANQLADYLDQFGVEAGDRVGICLEYGANTVLSMLAIHKLGAAFVVMDGDWPQARLTQVVESSGVSAIITEQVLLNPVADTDTDAMIVSLDRDWEDISTLGTDNFACDIGAQDTAYQIYTSGSTGVPKGVVISHSALFYYVQGVLPQIDIPAQSKWLALSTAAADLGYTATFGALASGGTLRMLPTSYSLDAEAMAQSLEKSPVDVIKIVPGHLAALMSVTDPVRLLPQKCLVMGGDAMPHQLVAQIKALKPQLRIVNHYGPSEATIGALCNQIDESQQDYQTFAIGYPMLHRQAYVVDDKGQLAGIGVSGEIYLGGEGIADGYHGNDELTAQQFIDNPFASSGNGADRLYKTGDLGRLRDDGRMEFLGRADHQVKRRGYRIELGEIEQVLLSHEQVNQVAVLFDNGELNAYVATDIEVDALQAFANEQLSEVMRPSHFMTMEQLPLTPNGKIDRKGLAKLEIEQVSAKTEYVAPRNEVEQTLADVWLSLLKVKQLGIDDNFFQSGGDSIIVIQVVARAREHGIKLTPMLVFENPTIAELAQVVEIEQIEQVSQSPVTGLADLAPRQQRFIEQYLQDATSYHRIRVLKVNGLLDVTQLQQTALALVTHHDSLRVTLVAGEDSKQQLFNDIDCFAAESLVDVHTLDCLDEASLQSQAKAILQQHQWPDLTQGPLFKLVYCHGSDGITGRLYMLAHPLVIDGVSWRFVQEDLISTYQQLSAGQELQLPAKTNSYQDWIAAQSEQGVAHAMADLDYWQQVALRADSQICPTHSKTTDCADEGIQHFRVQLSSDATDKLLHNCQSAFNIQVTDLLLSALVLTFKSLGEQSRISLDMEWHGRESDAHSLDLSRTAGWIAAIYPVVLDVIDSDDLSDVVKAVKENLRAIAGKGASHGVLRYQHRDSEVRTSVTPKLAPQLFFTYLGRFDHHLQQQGILSAGEQMGSTGNAKHRWLHLLEIHNSVVDEQLMVDWVFSVAHLSEQQVQGMAEHYLTHLNALIDYCSTHQGSYTPSDFPLAKVSQTRLDQVMAGQLLAGEDKSSVSDVYRLTKMQQGMISRSLIEPNAGVYIIQHAFEINGLFDEQAFKSAWLEIVQRHSVLRTQFVDLTGDAPLQVVRRQVELPWQSYDWSDLDVETQQQRYAQLMDDTYLVDYDYAKAPLMRLSFVRLSDGHYRFIWDNHHVLADGWSSGVIFQEVLALYRERVSGIRADLPKPVDYVKYVAWLDKRDVQASNDFWSDYLADVEPLQAPLTDREDRNAKYQTGQLNWLFDADITAKLTAVAQNNKITLNILMQGAWALLLSSYSYREDVVFGATVSGRPPQLDSVENMVGLFLNSLPVRTKITADMPLGEFLQNLQSNYIASEGHSYMPLVEIQRLSGHTDVQGLFETLIVFENQPRDEELNKNQPYSVSVLPASSFNHYPLSLIFVPGERLGLAFKYNGALYDESTIVNIQTHFKQLLQVLANATADTPIRHISYLPEAEVADLAKWQHAPTLDGIKVSDIASLFEANAKQNPERLALVTETDDFSYATLNEQANQLANYLEQFGVENGDIVGICVENSYYSVLSMLAILKLGAAFTVMDGQWPLSRMTYVVEGSEATAIITEQLLLNHVADTDTDAMIVSMDRDFEDIQTCDSDNLNRDISPSQSAYLIYTSGSTGTPKGVVISHRALHYYVEGMLPRIDVPVDSSWLALAGTAADLGYTSLFGALVSGGTLRLIPTEFNLDAEAIATSLAKRPVDVIKIVPSHLAALLNVQDAARLLPKRCLITGGDVLSPSLIQQIKQLAPELKLVNHYGPSETTIGALTCDITTQEAARQSIAIGRPMNYRQVYIVDAQQRMAPAGVIGEIYLGGEGMADGYHNLADMTAERFIAHPYMESGRLYRTGDLGRFRKDGQVEFFGRADHQVKRRGYRIELGEIEQVLMQHDGVKQIVVLLKQDQLLAFIATGADGEDVSELHASLESQFEQHAEQHLSEVMQPSRWVLMTKLPQTGNGKIDRRALAAMDTSTAVQSQSYVAPQNEVQQIMAEIWQQLLKVERVGIDENFFRLGGDSIVVIQLVAKARERGIKINPTQVFESPTVASLSDVAEFVGELNAQQSDVVGDSLMTPIQLRFFDVVTTEPQQYNQSYLYEINESLSLQLLTETVDHLLKHHDALRGRFVQVDGVWQQAFAEHQTQYSKDAVKHIVWDDSEQQLAIFEQTVAEIQAGFELAKGELFKLLWFDNGQDSRLLFICHHLLVDGVSWRVILEDFDTVYRALEQQQPVKLPSKTTAYMEWANRLHQDAQATRWQQELAYWQRLTDVEYDSLPNLAAPSSLEAGAKLHVSNLSSAESQLLLSGLHQAYNTEINDLLMSALYIALDKQFGMKRLLIELEGHGREDLFDDIDLSRTVGWFTSTFPVYFNVADSANIDAVVKGVKESLRQVPTKGVGFGVLRYLANAEQLNALPKTEVRFNYLGRYDQDQASGLLANRITEGVKHNHSPKQNRQYVLNINAMIMDGQLGVGIDYSSNQFDSQTIDAFAEQLMAALSAVIAHCGTSGVGGLTPSDLPDAQMDQPQLDKFVAELAEILELV